jgi:hypothetical protein
MKSKFIILIQRAACLLVVSALQLPVSTVFAQGTAFTYQGRLNDGDGPVNGNYDITFTLFGVSSGGSALAGPVTNSAVTVTNGLFTTTLDLGANFPGADRWLELAVRTNGGASFTTLAPRQPLKPTPYAITAGNITSGGLAGTYGNTLTFSNSGNSFNGTYTGNGAGISNVNALTLGGLGANQFWKISGNSNTVAGANYLGTADNQPLELHVNGIRALRIEPNTNRAPNLIGGAPINYVGPVVFGATVAGGGAINYFGDTYSNQVTADFGTVSGGANNTASGYQATVSGGLNNIASGERATVSGGNNNTANYVYATVGGGQFNISSGLDATVSGGAANTASDWGATVSGGKDNTAGSSGATVSGGFGNVAIGGSATVGGGWYNIARYEAATVSGGFNNTASNAYATVSGGLTNAAMNSYATVSGGANNIAAGGWATVSGGFGNTASNSYATVSGGQSNTSLGTDSTIGGGSFNTNSSEFYGTIGGGSLNLANGISATIAGGYQNSVLGNDSTIGGGSFNMNSAAANGTIGGGRNNAASGSSVTIAGGYQNSVGGTDSTIGGGSFNTNSAAFYGTIGGGSLNLANGNSATVAGGYQNTANNSYATVSGGNGNTANNGYATVSGGNLNTAGGLLATVSGGDRNTASGAYGTIPGGDQNVATSHAFAAGHRAKASFDGSFIWADANDFDFAANTENKVRFRCTGGFDIITAIDGGGNETKCLYLGPGGESWTACSDRNMKKNLRPVDTLEVVEKLAAVPISRWNYKSEKDDAVPHIGPMAQDFKAAFFPGRDDKGISTLEFDGVALAAIQGLNRKLDDQLKQRDAENVELKQTVAELKELVQALNNKLNGGSR